MRKTIYLLNIGNYAPEITAITYPLIERYARKICAQIEMIDERRSPAWDLDYEKLQIYELAQRRGDDWSIYIDSDALVHPELPDVTDLIPLDTNVRVRFQIDATSDPAATTYQLEAQKSGDAGWSKVT